MIYINKVHHTRAVMKCDKDTKRMIQVYGSVTEAAEGLEGGILATRINGITKVANGDGKTYKGYAWVWRPTPKTLAKGAINLQNALHK